MEMMRLKLVVLQVGLVALQVPEEIVAWDLVGAEPAEAAEATQCREVVLFVMVRRKLGSKINKL